ncbi:hypothetical protein OOU_Y34scaffold00502g19 [Pyricularia oryzae Y34]|uniref:MFS-type drug efflux transporter P55 n=1 Tax=Pyricularia oryzae (strain Y34) TaxID=1143189 RepID=A0AA97NZR2_PYRO3|nr:hypothetical protein OOU_Y34scaffold00502g19 [Pyricularia oryzae Y34]
MVALAAGKLMLALEITIISTAMPTIASALNMGGEYVWASNGAALASAAISPPLGQLSDLFGRRIPTGLSFLVFVGGGILSGAATTPAQLIAGRVVMGLGSGGINVMAAIVVSDLVPVRVRGNYMAIMLAAYLLGATGGPLLGGVLAQAGRWRWVFWLPVPFGVASLVLLALFLRGSVRDPHVAWRRKLAAGVLGSTPSRAGVQMLPIVTVAVPASIASVVLVSRLGRYKLLHVAGFAGMCLGCGLFSILGSASGDAEWAGYEVVFSLALGMVINTLLPAFQGAVAEKDQALATSTFTFVQSLAGIWAVTIPAAVFNNRFDALSGNITNEAVRAQLGGGRAYGSATRAFLTQLDEATRAEVLGVFQAAVSFVWYIAVAVGGLGVLVACAEREIVLREELETDFALEEVQASNVEDKSPR